MTMGVSLSGDPDWFWELPQEKQKDILITLECKHLIASGELNKTIKPSSPKQSFAAQGHRKHMTKTMLKNGSTQEGISKWLTSDR